MKRFLVGFVLGTLAGAASCWYFITSPENAPVRKAASQVASSAEVVRDKIQESVAGIRPEDIREELSKSSIVVREKAREAGEKIWDATANARTTAAIKAKLLAEPGLHSFSINVDTTDGLVTLSGQAPSVEEISKAIRIALETEGVRKVISTLQLKPATP